MIPFFRKTRKKLADDNKPMKYARYAIGEIALVVIGILIAVQINTWNEERKRNKDEQLLLGDLKFEILSNITDLEGITRIHQNALNDAFKLKNYFFQPEKISDISNDSLLRLTFSLHGVKFSPENGIKNSMMSSGQINIIRNKKLKYLLSSLNDYEIQKMKMSNRLNEMGIETFTKTIYPKAMELSLNGINYSYDVNVNKHLNWKNMYLIPEFRVAIVYLFTGNRSSAIKSEKMLKIRYEEVVSLIDIELKK
jgi:hypothetical protein